MGVGIEDVRMRGWETALATQLVVAAVAAAVPGGCDSRTAKDWTADITR